MINGSLVVLVVDDDDMVRMVVEAILEDRGHIVRTANSATAALTILGGDTGREIDLVLTDEMMPDMRGSQLLGIIADRWPNLPGAIISGYSERLVSEAPQLSKPFTSDGVADLIERLLRPR